MTESLGRILIVDDEQPVREVLSEYFEKQGYTTRTASGGAEALAAVERERPDLVLLDVRMPGLEGVEVLRGLRQADQRLTVITRLCRRILAAGSSQPAAASRRGFRSRPTPRVTTLTANSMAPT